MADVCRPLELDSLHHEPSRVFGRPKGFSFRLLFLGAKLIGKCFSHVAKTVARVLVEQKSVEVPRVLVQVHRFSFLIKWMSSFERAGQEAPENCSQESATPDLSLVSSIGVEWNSETSMYASLGLLQKTRVSLLAAKMADARNRDRPRR